jgi:hypothetical protein
MTSDFEIVRGIDIVQGRLGEMSRMLARTIDFQHVQLTRRYSLAT